MEHLPFLLQAEKGAYTWRDIERLCQKYQIPWRRPSEFPRRALLPTRIALLGASEPWIGAFCRRVMHLNFAEDLPIDSAEVMLEVLSTLTPRPAELITAAQSDDTKTRLRTQTDIARSRGIFGAPMFFAGHEMFWGNDRLEDAVALAAAVTVSPSVTQGALPT